MNKSGEFAEEIVKLSKERGFMAIVIGVMEHKEQDPDPDKHGMALVGMGTDLEKMQLVYQLLKEILPLDMQHFIIEYLQSNKFSGRN